MFYELTLLQHTEQQACCMLECGCIVETEALSSHRMACHPAPDCPAPLACSVICRHTVQCAGTWEGIQAAKQLEDQGVATHIILVYR